MTLASIKVVVFYGPELAVPPAECESADEESMIPLASLTTSNALEGVSLDG